MDSDTNFIHPLLDYLSGRPYQIEMNHSSAVDIESILAAYGRTHPFMVQEHYLLITPILKSPALNALCGGDKELIFKCESLQTTGSFKSRGALNAVFCARERARKRGQELTGVITQSSGNHGKALAWAAARLRLRCVVVVPENAPANKCAAIEAYGGELVRCKATMADRWSTCQEWSGRLGYPIIDPHNDFDVMSGQGTIGVELLHQVKNNLDAIILSVGGGGLAAGVSKYVKAKKNIGAIKVFCAEPLGKELQKQLEAGELEPSTELLQTVADGVRVKKIGDKCFHIILENCEKTVFTLNDDEIRSATRLIWEHLKVVVEPSAAIPLAAVLKYGSSEALKGCKRIGLILCGGNVDFPGNPNCICGGGSLNQSLNQLSISK